VKNFTKLKQRGIMPDATTTTNTTGANTLEQELGCTMCLATFESKEMKRVHMKEDWQ
jgi:pre-60S factor REI1